MATPLGLVFVFGDPGEEVSVDEFNDWYDNEHGPARVAVPGLTNAARYEASDGIIPGWLTMGDLATPSIARSEPYKALASQVSERERSLVPRLATLNRRIYEVLSEKRNSSVLSTAFPAKFILVITARVQPELEEEFTKWHEEEHTPKLLELTGCLRARRFKIVDSIDLTGKTDLAVDKVHNYIAIYEWDNGDYNEASEIKASLKTPWSLKIFGSPNEISFRRFIIHRSAQKPE